MKRAIAAAILGAAILIAGCSNGPTLTDAQLLWCTEHWEAARDAADALGLKDSSTVWYGNRGVTLDDNGSPSSLEKAREVTKDFFADPENTTLDERLAFYDAQDAEWFESSDGARACIAAYDLR